MLKRFTIPLAFAFMLCLVSTSQVHAQSIIAHPAGMGITKDPAGVNINHVDVILTAAADFWPEIPTVWDAQVAYDSGNLKIIKIRDNYYDYAVVYKGDCAVIALGSSHF